MTNYVNKEGNSLQIRLYQKNIKLGIILAKKDKKYIKMFTCKEGTMKKNGYS